MSLSHDRATLSLVVERYAALLAADRALLLPVVGSLFDLPLSGALAAQAAGLVIAALDVVSEKRETKAVGFTGLPTLAMTRLSATSRARSL